MRNLPIWQLSQIFPLFFVNFDLAYAKKAQNTPKGKIYYNAIYNYNR